LNLLSVPPLRPSLRKHKSVTFDNSIDEVDVKNRSSTRSLVYDIPRKQSSMVDLYAQSVKITPQDKAIFLMSQKPGFNTYPRKNVSRKQSMEHIYAEIPIPNPIAAMSSTKIEKSQDLSPSDSLYENQESIEKTKM
jgi:hypothetical protein